MTTDIWNGTGNWSTDDAAWSETRPPLAAEDAEIATGTAILTSGTTIAGLQVDAPATLELTTGGSLVDTGTAAVAGYFYLQAGGAANITGNLSITGAGRVDLDPYFLGGSSGGSTLTVGGTLTNNSTDANAIDIGYSGIGAGDTLTAGALVNSGTINIEGNGTIVAMLAVNGPATNNATVNIDASGIVQMGTGDIYTQAADATNIASGGTLAGTVDLTGGAVNIAAGGVLAGTANVTGGFLDGTGTVVGTVNDTSGGTLFGGPSIGTPGMLTVTGTYNQSGTGKLEANIGSGGTSSGVVTVTPGFFVNLSGGTLSVSGTPAVGSLLTVMTLGSGELVGQFAAVQDGSSIGDGSNVNLGDGTTLEVFYNADAGNIQIERVNNAGLATSYQWTDATGNWSTAADWSGGQVPNPTANVVIGNTTTGNVTLNGSSGETTVNSLSILASNALTVSGLTLTSATGGGGISVAANGTLSLSSGRIDGSVLSGAGLLQTVGGGVSVLAGDTISANTSFIGQDATQTGLLGAIDNAGTFELIGGNGQSSDLLILNAVTLTGGGTVTLDDIATGGGNAILGGSGETLTNVSNTIQGTGIIGNGALALINEHVIDATPEGGSSTLTLNGSGVTNTGTMEAAAGAALVINTAVVDNAGGTIKDLASTSTVELDNATVQGGTLNDTAGGTLETVSGATLDGSTHGALTLTTGSTYTASDNTTTNLLGSIVNDALIQQNGGNEQNGALDLVGAVTLSGGGTVKLDTVSTNGGSAYLEGNGETLTNVNDTILGTGVIGNGSLALINEHVIDATPEGGTSTLTLSASGGVTNTDLLEATAGGVLAINNTVDNANGNITVSGATSTVELVNATVQGGTLNTTGGGTLETVSGATLDGSTHGALTISTGSTYTASDNTTTNLLGSIVNDGLLQQNGGNEQNGALDLVGAVTLSGGGTVTLDTVATNGGNAYLVGNGQTLTNTNNTIQGTGIIGDGNIVLINGGVIDATPEGGTKTLTLNGSLVTNTNLLEATAGGTLAITTNVTNTGANITATGSLGVVTVSNSATITSGTLNIVNGGVFASTGNSTLQGLTISAGSTFTSDDNQTTVLLGTIDNLGTLEQIGGNEQNGYVNIGNAVTLTGSGTVTLDSIITNGGSAYIQGNGQTLTNTNNTIQGTGFIGNGSLALVNGGVIDATPEGGTSTLTLNGSQVTNTSTMEASAGGALVINTTVDNAGGNITTADATSTVEIYAGSVQGGTLNNTTAGGVFETADGSTLDGSTQGALTISTGSTVTATDNTNTTLLGTIHNEGLLEQIGGNEQNGSLNIGNAVTLTGGGTVTLDTILTDGGSAYIQGNGQTLTNSNNTIQGTGIIGNGSLVLLNEHVIDATPESGTSSLTLNGSGGITNTSTMEASAGGILVINTTVDNAGGNITTADATSTVEIDGATVQGGTLNNTAGGTFETAAGSTLDGSTHGALTISSGSTVTATDNTTTDLLGAIDNEGLLEQIGGNEQNGSLNLTGAVTLTGGGTVKLDTISTNGGNAYLEGNGETLTNVNDTILGTGVIGNGSLALINEHVIDAAPEGGTSTLTLNGSGGVTNTSTMEASVGGALVINTTVDNAGGNITTADATSTVAIDGATVQGGTLNNTAGGTFETVAGSTLDGSTQGALTISSGSTVTATDNTTTNLLGTIDNKGLLEQIGGNEQNGLLNLTNALTLTGGGTVTLDSISTNGGNAYLIGNGETLTNTNNTIQGTGIIGDGGSLALINGGVIDATPEGGTSTLTINTSGAFTSTGTLEATGGATLALDVGAVTVSSLVSVAANSALDLDGELTVNGTLSNFGAVSGGPATEVAFGSGTDRLILGPAATFGGNVVGGGANTTLELAAGSSAGTLNALGTTFTNFGTVTVDAGATWTVDAATSLLPSTTFIGDGASSTLVLSGAGTFSLATVSNFGTIDLPAGNDTVTVTDKTLSGVAVTINDGASGNNTVTAAADTSASKGKTLNYFTGAGTDSLTGGFENDVVHVSAAAVGGDVLTGGSGANTLILTSAGGVNLGGVSKFRTIDLAAGNNTVTLTDTTLSGGTVLLYDGTSGNNTVSAAGDTSASKGKALNYFTGPGTDSFTGGFENDQVHVSAAAVGGDALTGGGGTNTLTLTSAGTANLGGVSKFRTIDLAAGNNTVTLTDTTLSGGTVLLYDGTSGNNTVSAAGDTSASKGKALNYFTGSGTDSFTGGFENDQIHVSAAAVGGDVLTGGSGANALFLASAGTVNLHGVSKFGTVDLFAGNNTVTLTDTTLSGGTVVLNDGSSGNDTVSASDTTASKGKALNYFTGAGTDSFTGGFENDTVHVSAAAVGGDTLTGSNGANALIMTSASTVNLGGVSRLGAIDLAAGNSTVTVTNTTLSGGAVTINDGASGNNTVSAAGDTSASKAKTLIYFTGSGADSFTGGFETDIVHVSASAVGGDTLTGGSGGNTLMLSSAGTVNLGGVSKFATVNLAAGSSTVTVTDTTLSGPTSETINDGASGNNTVSAASDTSVSTGKTLNYVTGSGTDKFTGGFENDAIRVSAAAVGGDTLTGGSGSNTLTLTNAGTVNLGGVSKFRTINLAAGGNTVTVADTTLSGGTVVLTDGASGNDTVSAASDTSASKGKALNYYTGPGADSFTGGLENDSVHVSAAAVGGDTLTGGSGANALFLTSAGTVNLGGVSKFHTINLQAGGNTATVTDTTLSGGTVVLSDGASGNNTVSAASDTSASRGKALNYYTGPGTDSFTGGFENDTVHVSAAAVGGDTLTGGSGSNALFLNSAGTFNLGSVSKFGTVDLFAGNNSVTLTDTTLSGGTVVLNDGASGKDIVSAAGDSSASKGKALNYFTGAGTDSFTGGFEKDTVHVSAAAVGSDTLTGGSGANTLTLSSAGTVNLGGVSKFGTINLASGSNTVTVTDTTLSGGSVTINAGSTGNDTVSAAGDTAASKGTTLTFDAGSGTNGFTGGQENDTIYAGTGLGSFTAGSGSDTFVFIKSNLPNQTLNDFQVSTDDILVYGTHSAGGFDLGSTDNALNPTTPTAISVADFVANASGDFTNSSQRFAYDTTNGQLLYSATGSNTSESLFATLTGAPSITAGNILFEH